VSTVSGAAFIWDTRRKMKVAAPDTIPDAMLADSPGTTSQSV